MCFFNHIALLSHTYATCPLSLLRPYTNRSQDEIPIVQAALLGSILANLLLILGMCFLVGGLRFREQVTDVFYLFIVYISNIPSPDLQQHCHTDERLSSQHKRHESSTSSKFAVMELGILY